MRNQVAHATANSVFFCIITLQCPSALGAEACILYKQARRLCWNINVNVLLVGSHEEGGALTFRALQHSVSLLDVSKWSWCVFHLVKKIFSTLFCCSHLELRVIPRRRSDARTLSSKFTSVSECVLIAWGSVHVVLHCLIAHSSRSRNPIS